MNQMKKIQKKPAIEHSKSQPIDQVEIYYIII